MKREFTKMEGCGNDYIYFDCTNNREIENVNDVAIKLSDRHFGIGGDGVILICDSKVADAKMRMFNLDGSEGKMCGNGIRCVAKYCYDHKIVDKKDFSIETLSGIKYISIKVGDDGLCSLVSVNMGKAELNPKNIPVNLNSNMVVNEPYVIDGVEYKITCVSMGNPHCIVYVDDVNNIDIEKIGPKFEFDKIFPQRVNTEFIQVIDNKTLKMRVWERGSGETFACGTGACASAVSSVLNGICKRNEKITVKLLGGDLDIEYKDDGTVYMTGPAKEVFVGEVDI